MADGVLDVVGLPIHNSPKSDINTGVRYGPLAHLVEHLICNEGGRFESCRVHQIEFDSESWLTRAGGRGSGSGISARKCHGILNSP